MKIISIILSFCLALAILPRSSNALKIQTPGQQTEQADEQEVLQLLEVATKITEIVPEYDADQAVQLAKSLELLKEDEETQQVLQMLQSGDLVVGNEEEIKKAEHKDLVTAMIVLFDELKAMEVLFRDPQKAVEAVAADGLFENEEALNFFRENPAQLEQEMKQRLYISFIQVANAAGYL